MPATRGQEWQDIRERIISFRGRYCQRCKISVPEPTPLILHHIDGDRMNDYDGNLMLLCEECHDHFAPKVWRQK